MSTRADVLALCLQRTGKIREARKVSQFIFEWEMAVRVAGGPITVDEYAHHWKDSPATGYRKLAMFRELFPELGERGMPHDLMRPLLEALENSAALPDGVVLAL